MLLYVIRHGETDWNKQKRFQGHTDIPLNEKGIRLAEQTGEAMKGIHLDYAISSPLKRAVQTAEYIVKGRNIPILTEERLKEIGFGDWEGDNVLAPKRMPVDFLEKFYHHPLDCQRPPNGEKFADVIARMDSFYEDLIRNPKYEHAAVLISTHGAASRCFLYRFCKDPGDFWQGGVPKNCCVSLIEVKNGVGKLLEKDRCYYEEKGGTIWTTSFQNC